MPKPTIQPPPDPVSPADTRVPEYLTVRGVFWRFRVPAVSIHHGRRPTRTPTAPCFSSRSLPVYAVLRLKLHRGTRDPAVQLNPVMATHETLWTVDSRRSHRRSAQFRRLPAARRAICGHPPRPASERRRTSSRRPAKMCVLNGERWLRMPWPRPQGNHLRQRHGGRE